MEVPNPKPITPSLVVFGNGYTGSMLVATINDWLKLY